MTTAMLTGALALTGCGGHDAAPPASAEGTSSAASTTPTASSTGEDTTSSSAPTAGASGSALPEDWTPEEPTVLATGQKVPDDYEPATLEHPARNVPKPVMPAEADEESEAGAQAFLNYRADAQWYAMQTGDTSLVRDTTASECSNCIKQFDDIEALYKSGGWALGGWEKLNMPSGSFEKRADGGYNLPVYIDSKGSLTVDHSERSVAQRPFSGGDILDVYIDYKNGRWRHVTASPRGSM